MAFLLPQALIEVGVTDIGVIRVDFAQASALKGFLESIYSDDGVTFPVDVAVPPGTTDYSQFLLAAENGGATVPSSRSASRRPCRSCGPASSWAPR